MWPALPLSAGIWAPLPRGATPRNCCASLKRPHARCPPWPAPGRLGSSQSPSLSPPPFVRKALIVAHGQPGDPVPQQNAVEALAARVAALLPQAQVRGATLAMPGALDIADDKTLIYPLFMATGWFTRSELPRRLTLSGAALARVLPPFGSDPGLPSLCLALISEAAAGQRWSMAQTHLLIAAHGSRRSRAPAEAAQEMAKALAPHVAAVARGSI